MIHSQSGFFLKKIRPLNKIKNQFTSRNPYKIDVNSHLSFCLFPQIKYKKITIFSFELPAYIYPKIDMF